MDVQALLDVSAASGNRAHEIVLACLNTLSGKDGGMFDKPISEGGPKWLCSATASMPWKSTCVGRHKVLLGDKCLLTLH